MRKRIVWKIMAEQPKERGEAARYFPCSLQTLSEVCQYIRAGFAVT
jgi:hypothetical protein